MRVAGCWSVLSSLRSMPGTFRLVACVKNREKQVQLTGRGVGAAGGRSAGFCVEGPGQIRDWDPSVCLPGTRILQCVPPLLLFGSEAGFM